MTIYLQALAKSGVIGLGVTLTVAVTLLLVIGTCFWVRSARKEEKANAAKPLAPNPMPEREEPAAEQTVAEQEEPVAEQPVAEREEPVAEQPVAEREEPVAEQPVAEREEPVAEQPVADEIAAAEEEQSDQPYPAFIQSVVSDLPEEQSAALESVVLHNSENLNVRVKVPVSQYEREQDFLADFFRSCAKFAKRLPIAVTENLYERQKPYADTDRKKVALRRKMISAYYARRKEEDTLPQCEVLCKEDVAYHLQTLGIENVGLPPLKRLIIVCVAQTRFDDALAYCDMAIRHNIIDHKGIGYEERKQKIESKKAKAEERMRKAALKAQKQ